MKLTQHQEALLERAKARRIEAAVAYKRAWLTDPTPRGYPSVDRALSRLELAEAQERAAEAGQLPLDAFEQQAA